MTTKPISDAFQLSQPDDIRLPLVVSPTTPDDFQAALRAVAEHGCDLLAERGTVLFRGFGIGSPERFAELVSAGESEMLPYINGSTPRSRVSGNVYTSTEYPADQHIPMHNEMAYATAWPEQVWFYCQTAAAEGGCTPLADSRRIYRAIKPEIRQKFANLGVRYVRNYRRFVDVPWQEAFDTEDRHTVETICRESGIEFRWDGDDLKTWQVCQGVATHPRTGDSVWFNQAHLFHVSNLPPKVRDALSRVYKSEDLPRNAMYGNGEPIPDAVLDEIRAAIDRETITFPWQSGDVLLVDNMLIAHGREPYVGDRLVLVAMTGARSSAAKKNGV